MFAELCNLAVARLPICDIQKKAAAELTHSRRLGDPKLLQGFNQITSQAYRQSGHIARTPC